tara:strand:- start:34 stop:651 length:618 start_codon:yes stop_codon:yes gene_type:complete
MSIVKLNNNGVKNATAIGSISSLGTIILIKKLTASSSSTLSFVDGSSDVVLDSTYKEYFFTFNNIHCSGTGQFGFQGNAAGGADFNETMTTTNFRAIHAEADNDAEVGYVAGEDQANGTGLTLIAQSIDTDNDASLSGYLHLFNPSSTTFVKNFFSTVSVMKNGNYAALTNASGYFNTTSAIDEIEFKFNSGNIDAGDICLYGIN